ITETTGAAAAYVAMTRGRDNNTAHLVANDIDDAKRQWIDVFSRTRADLGPAHARSQAIDEVDRYGSNAPRKPQRRTASVEPVRPASPQRDTAIGL
ncbi:MAG: AAA family ATPase, partial [Candidatus Limnocylindria bacterium]